MLTLILKFNYFISFHSLFTKIIKLLVKVELLFQSPLVFDSALSFLFYQNFVTVS